MTNETTASQPKSIGDDAQCSPIQYLHNVCADVVPALLNCGRQRLADLLEGALLGLPVAPAAQASATIQAAPDVAEMVNRFLGWKLPTNFQPDAGISFDKAYGERWGMPSGTNLLNADQAKAMFKHCLATTIQEPVMVAEPVSNIRITLRQALGLVEFFGGHDADVTVTERPAVWEQIEEGLYAFCTEYPEEGAQFLGATEVDDELMRLGTGPAAPMVADSAGVARQFNIESVDGDEFRKLCDAYHCASQDQVEDSYQAIYEFVDEMTSDIGHRWRAALAATVKAVPSESMPVTQEPKYGIRDNRLFNRASGEFIPADEPVFIFRARDVHAANAIGWYAGDVRNPEHYGAVHARVKQFRVFADENPNRMKEPDTVNFAAPLADKTGGGE